MNVLHLFERRSAAGAAEPCNSASVARSRLQMLFTQERAVADRSGTNVTPQASAETLSPAQAACLNAIRAGKVARRQIAVTGRLSQKATSDGLDALCERGLIRRDPHSQGWVLTELGQNCSVESSERSSLAEDQHLKSGLRIERLGQSLLELLDQPRSGREIAQQLNLSPNRVRQLISRLIAMGKVRAGDPNRMTLVVARADDPSVLLTYVEERILSSLPQLEETTPSLMAAGLRLPVAEVLQHLSSLSQRGLIRELGESKRGMHYRLNEAGLAHTQYRLAAKKVRAVPLAVKSYRAHLVLSHLAEHGPGRTRDLKETLQIPQGSISALMQNLKRKGLVRKLSESLTAPFELTEQGLLTQQALSRRLLRSLT